MSPELATALDLVMARTHHEPFLAWAEMGGEHEAAILRMAAQFRGEPPPPPSPVADHFKLKARRAACPHLGPVCSSGCAGDVHECLAGRSPWPGQPSKASLNDCIQCLAADE